MIAGCANVALAGTFDRVEPDRYTVSGSFWPARIKHLIVHHVPYAMDMIEQDRSEWKIFARFKAVAAKRAGENVENPLMHNWAEAPLLNTFESMCWALTVDAAGDREIDEAQQRIRDGIERWIPVILNAQEPDGYLCTDAQMRGYPRFYSPDYAATNVPPNIPTEDTHEGYLMGYLMECAIAHVRATGSGDLRMYHAAKKAADLLCASLGDPPKIPWQPDHAGLEMALVRFATLTDEIEGPGTGSAYIELAHWLLKTRGVTPPHTDQYRQKNKPLAEQKEPYGHAVMFGYLYAGGADIARVTGDTGLQTVCDRLWNRLVNGKMYITGGVGSQNEEFGASFDLPNDSRLGESCANIGNLFFQSNMNLLHADARYADVAEIALYNSILGSLALHEPKWQYFNQLDQHESDHPTGRHNRKPDCCVGNISRTLLRLPTWIYAKTDKAIVVNQFIGSRVTLRRVAGVDVTLEQKTDYPWSGKVSLLVHPEQPASFSLQIRAPGRRAAKVYTGTPEVSGIESLTVNGESVAGSIEHGYVSITRTWSPGDRIDLTLPMPIQRVHADERIKANANRVALMRGPLVYNIESCDLAGDRTLDDVALAGDAPLAACWNDDLLGGVMTLRGLFADGSSLLAIPNFARMNRACTNGVARSIVWIKKP